MKFKLLLTITFITSFASQTKSKDLRSIVCKDPFDYDIGYREFKRAGRFADITSCIKPQANMWGHYYMDDACADPIKEKACLNAKEGDICVLDRGMPFYPAKCKKNKDNKLSCENTDPNEFYDTWCGK